MRIGLYGGSFDPAHAGHRHVAVTALRRLRLDRVWWMVTPGNPLKDRRALPPSAKRVRQAQAVAAHPRMIVTGFEEEIGAVYTVETVRYLLARCPGVRFVFIVGADSFANFHRWRAWREIAAHVPIAVVDRPRWGFRALRSTAARALAARRIPPEAAALLPDLRAPAWAFLSGPRSELSSTTLRDRALRDLDRR